MKFEQSWRVVLFRNDVSLVDSAQASFRAARPSAAVS